MTRQLNHHLIDRNGVWYISWAYKGQRHSATTGIPVGLGTEEKRAHLKLAREWRDKYQGDVRRSRGRDPEGLWRELRRTLAELEPTVQADLRRRWADELLAEVGRRVPLSEAWELWQRDPQRGNAGEVTLRQYESEWRRFEGWAAGMGIETLQDVTAARAREYAAALWGEKVTAGTFNAHVSFLRSLWSVLMVPLSLRENPWLGVRRVSAAPEGRREFTEAELRTLCERSTGAWRVMIGLGLYAALRLGDVVCLPWAAVDLTMGTLRWTPSKTRRKGDKGALVIPLHPGLAGMLRERQDLVPGEWIFPAERERYLRDRSSLPKEFAKLLAEVGIVTTEAASGQRTRAVVRYGFHSLRHSFVSICRRAGVQEQVVMGLVGHGSPAMTRLYTHTTDADRATAIGSLPAMN